MKTAITNQRLSREPINLDEHNWYYEEPKAVVFVHEVYDGDRHIRTDLISIPWKRLAESVSRKYRAALRSGKRRRTLVS